MHNELEKKFFLTDLDLNYTHIYIFLDTKKRKKSFCTFFSSPVYHMSSHYLYIQQVLLLIYIYIYFKSH